ncbi:hypothetical protein QR680_019020 [Steinernema hermaphroditum]|uniref:Peptidase M16 N-terminal domain-containing protein n=1 Tax=Steinernema hermaphroditum TaxID=289476 RepID=A0AA39LRQ5_9BILA|nr:hypothetical protein QR680_019020 [Steinernema hermaphroditum]
MIANRVQNGERRFRKKAKKNKRPSEKEIRAIKLKTQVAAVSRRFDDTENPDRHRVLDFRNGLRVFLVSNRSKTSSAATLDVRVGSSADPEDIPGMAHLCEHLLFEGSEKYPMDSGLRNFVKRSGGEMNACTYDHCTNFDLEVPPKFLKGALDRLMHNLISPLFGEHSIAREIEVVDSEFRNYEKDDDRRITRICRVLSRPGHDFRKFAEGNRQTLLEMPMSKGLRIRDEVVKFFKKHYSSNVMSLCLLGPQSLDELEALVLSLPFLEIPNRYVTPKDVEEPHYGPEETGYRVDVVPVKNERYLAVKFAVQHSVSTLENIPICRWLKYQGEGSLERELKQRGWSYYLRASKLGDTWGEIDVEIGLTQEGLDHVEDIVQLLFVYIGMLKRTGPRRAPPRRQSSELGETSMYQTVPSLVREIRNQATKRDSLETTSIKSVLDQLTPRNMIYFVVAKENSELENLEREQYYGIEYRKTKLDAASLKRFERALRRESELFYLPEKDGESSPAKSVLKTRKKRENEKPQILKSDQVKRVWYLRSRRAERPFTEMSAYLTLPRVASDAKSQVMAQLFTRCFEHQTREEFYDVKTAGFEASVEPHCRGLKLTFSDFDDRISQTVGAYMRRVISFEPEKKAFDVVLDALKHELINVDVEQPYDQGDYLLDYVLTEGGWPNWRLLEALERVTFENLVEFVPTLWSALHLELFVHGTLAEDEVLRLCGQILPENDSPERPLSSDELAPLRKLKIPIGVSYFYEHTQAIHSNNCVVFCLQVEPGARNCSLLQFLGDMISVPLFDTLRTKEQLGYVVWISLGKSKLTDCNDLRLTVQGPHEPDFVESRIEAFLESFKSTLVEMSESDFDEYKEPFRRKTEKVKCKNYRQEIESKRFSFDDSQLQVAECLQIQREDLLDFYERTIVAGAERRKVSIWVRSVSGHKGPRAEGSSGTVEIENLERFKDACEAYPEEEHPAQRPKAPGTVYFAPPESPSAASPHSILMSRKDRFCEGGRERRGGYGVVESGGAALRFGQGLRRRSRAAEARGEGMLQIASRGYRLGGLLSPMCVVPPQQVTLTLKLWEDGFSIDDGPLRRFDAPENVEFVAEVRRGCIPKELQLSHKGSRLDVRMMCMTRRFADPKRRVSFVEEGDTHKRPKIAAFFGKGHLLGGPSGGDAPKPKKPKMRILSGQSVLICLPSGRRAATEFGPSETVADLRSYMLKIDPMLKNQPFRLINAATRREIPIGESSLSSERLFKTLVIVRLDPK